MKQKINLNKTQNNCKSLMIYSIVDTNYNTIEIDYNKDVTVFIIDTDYIILLVDLAVKFEKNKV